MKITILLISLAGHSLSSGQSFIRQIHTVQGQAIVYDIAVSSDNGSVMSRPLTTESAVFQLYTNVTGTNNTTTLKKLDEKVVGTFLPASTVEVLSEDPYYPPRTRADKPYGIRLNVSGLLPDSPEVPAYAKTVYLSRSYGMYDATSYQPNGTTGVYADQFSFQQNGTFVDNGIIQRLPGDFPSKAVGEESFTVTLHPDAGQVSELAKTTVQIWPVAVAEIAGIEEGKRYLQVPTEGRFSVRDVYPNSVTYAQIYKGAQQTGQTGTPLPSTVVSYNTHLPQTLVLTLTDLESYMDGDGTYTIEILTITPFNNGAPELLKHVSFEMKRTLKVNASVTTNE